MSEDLVGASQWERDLYDHVTQHVKVEGGMLSRYKALADDPEGSAAFRFAANLILDDERRHHQLFNDLAESIRQLSELRAEDEPIPGLQGLAADRERVLAATEELLANELEDERELKKLAKDLKDVRDTTFWGLLVEVMKHDTKKHQMILKFIRDRANDRF